MQKGSKFFLKLFIYTITILILWFNQFTQAYASTAPLTKPQTINAFELTSGTHQPFNNQSLQGHWTLLYFGFTNSTSTSPTAMATLNKAYVKLAIANKTLPQVVFVSIDPDRDSIAQTQKYATSFNENFEGATGNKDQLQQLTKQLKVSYSIPDQNSAINYQIKQSNSILVIDPKGRLYAIFSAPHNSDQIAKDYAAITSHYS